MKTVWRWFIRSEERRMQWFEVIGWWELLRIPYNIIILGLGLGSFVLFLSFIQRSGVLRPGEDAVEPVLLLVAPVAINLCYTLGWPVELLLRAAWQSAPNRVGLVLWLLGFVVSLEVVMLPSLVWGLRWLIT